MEGLPTTYLEAAIVYIAVKSELRKEFESLNRLGLAFWHANPLIKRYRIGEVRQLLTHDYGEVDRAVVWDIAIKEAPSLLRRLKKAKVPREE